MNFGQKFYALIEIMFFSNETKEVNGLSFKVKFMFESFPRIKDILNVISGDLIHLESDIDLILNLSCVHYEHFKQLSQIFH